jgi:hypothetical protein
MTATRTTFFLVAPADDAAFAAGRPAAAGAALLRALRRDVPFRFVTFGGGDPPAAPFPAHAADYDVSEEQGEPAGAGGVLLLAPCAAAPGEDERFLAAWASVRAALSPRRGFLGTRLHRAAGPAEFRFVAVVRWSSPLMYARALREPEIADAVAGLPGEPALYLPVPSQVMP